MFFVTFIHSRTIVTMLDTFNEQNRCFSTDTGTKTKKTDFNSTLPHPKEGMKEQQ